MAPMRMGQRELVAALALTLLLGFVRDMTAASAGAVQFVCRSGTVSIKVADDAVVPEEAIAALLHANLAEGKATSDDVVRLLLASGVVSAYDEKEDGLVYAIEQDPSLTVIRRWLVFPPRTIADLAKIRATLGAAPAEVWSTTLPTASRADQSWGAYRALSALVCPEDGLVISVRAPGDNGETAVRLVVWNALLGAPQYSFRHSPSDSVFNDLAAVGRQTTPEAAEVVHVLTVAAEILQAPPAERAPHLWRRIETDPSYRWAFGFTEALALEAKQRTLWLQAALASRNAASHGMAEQLADRKSDAKVIALATALVDQALANQRDDPASWLLKADVALAGWALNGRGLAVAETAYRTSAELARDWYLPYARLAEVYAYRGYWQMSMAAFEKAIDAAAPESRRHQTAERFIFGAVVVGPSGAGKRIADRLVDRRILTQASAQEALAVGFEASRRYSEADMHWQASGACLTNQLELDRWPTDPRGGP
jgi:hypothetical protein